MSRFESGHRWDERSVKVRETLAPDLRLVMDDALRLSRVPFQMIEGARTIERQRELFRTKKSKVDPDSYPNTDALYASAKHIVGPGMPHARAVDIIVATKGKTYDQLHLCHVAGFILAAGRIRGLQMRWGGNFDRDDEILEQQFDDLPHFELG